ncbi:MAG: hypothetical protein RI932_407 [Pseudomonadota bacterium]|jgi:maleamate amidohydrolase
MNAAILKPGNKPALIVIDVMKAYTDPHSPMFMKSAVAALEPIASVVRFVRREGHPIFFTRMEFPEGLSAGEGLLLEKVPALRELKPGSKWTQFVDADISPHTNSENSDFHDEIEIVRNSPSAFHATSLAHHLMLLGCDTLFVVGFTTSSAVRATVIDALLNGIRPFVVQECVADRVAELNRVHLLDLQSHWGEVVSLQQAAQVHAGMRSRSVP